MCNPGRTPSRSLLVPAGISLWPPLTGPGLSRESLVYIKHITPFCSGIPILRYIFSLSTTSTALYAEEAAAEVPSIYDSWCWVLTT